MSQTPTTLRSVLESCDMLIIDDLHAWQFTLNDSEPALLIECMDGRNRRVWSFTAEELAAARQDGDDWQLRSAQGEHRLQCLGAICADNDDEPDDEPGAESSDAEQL